MATPDETRTLRSVSAGWVNFAQALGVLGVIGSIALAWRAAQVEGYFGTETDGGAFVSLALVFIVGIVLYLAPIFLNCPRCGRSRDRC